MSKQVLIHIRIAIYEVVFVKWSTAAVISNMFYIVSERLYDYSLKRTFLSRYVLCYASYKHSAVLSNSLHKFTHAHFELFVHIYQLF